MIGQHYQRKNFKDGLILIATPEGDLHEIGILAAALLCVHYGIRFIFLGVNLPAQSMAEAANALNPDHILLGVIIGHELHKKQTLDDYIGELSTKLKVKPLKPYIRTELEKKKIPFFASLDKFDEWLKNY
jgi:methanogenic corrinoid protein MtbC1